MFYFCHLWATQLLIHMQMKLAPSPACITASARCSVHSALLSLQLSFTFFSASLRSDTLPGREKKRGRDRRKEGARQIRKGAGLAIFPTHRVSVWTRLRQGTRESTVAALQRVCSLCYCSTVGVVSRRRRQRKGQSCLLSWSLP